MKKTLYLIVAMVLALTGCRETFEKEYNTLAVDRMAWGVTFEEGSLPFTVYCSGKWTARLAEECSWARLDKSSGKGVTTLHLLYDENGSISRAVNILLRGGGKELTVRVVQNAGFAFVKLELLKSTVELPGGAYRVSVPVRSNLPARLLTDIKPSFSWLAGGEDWIQDVELTDPGLEPVMEEGESIWTYELHFSVSSNKDGSQRAATMTYAMVDAGGNTVGGDLQIVQSADQGSITLADATVPYMGGTFFSKIVTDLQDFLSEFQPSVTYEDPSDPFLTDLHVSNDTLFYTVTENTRATQRQARLSVTYTDVEGNIVSGGCTLLQRMPVLAREVGFDALRSIATTPGEEATYTDGEDHRDYILGRIIGDRDNPNMDHNPNLEANNVTTEENDKTNYIQNVDGSLGYRLKFASPEEDTTRRYDLVRIFLDGVKVVRENDPERYTIVSLMGTSVEVLSHGAASDLPAKVKTIATLTPEDVYTYTTLKDMEFSVKDGAYTNVREFDAVDNPVRAAAGNFVSTNSNNARPAKDGAANVLYDADGNAIYALINMNCTWRRTGKTVPQGYGNASGIIVHQEMPRWGWNIGTYSLRPVEESDFAISEGRASRWNTLAEWVLNSGTKSIAGSPYHWQGEATYGTKGSNPFQQHRMIQTDRTDATYASTDVAVLYSENLKLHQGTTSGAYGLAPMNGYRSLTVDDYDPAFVPSGNTQANFDQSCGTVLGVYANINGWWNWKPDGSWDGSVNGIVLEIPTQGKSGSGGLVNFSACSGAQNNSQSCVSWTNTTSFPIFWTVEYAVSDDGTTFSAWQPLDNAATGKPGFKMTTLPFALKTSSTPWDFATAASGKAETKLDFGFGITPFSFRLPAAALGHKLTRIRIAPNWRLGEQCLIVASFSGEWNEPLESAGLKMISGTQVKSIRPYIMLEDVRVLYK